MAEGGQRQHATNLAHQANGATRGHAQAAQDLTPSQQQEIVAFETGLATAQRYDANAGDLATAGGRGGAAALAGQRFWFGINDFAYGDYRISAAFDATVFRLYANWIDAPITRGTSAVRAEARRAIARGEALFNARTFDISGVAGFIVGQNLVIDGGSVNVTM